ncbi:MAG: DUF6252 family protein [Bacteroidia bacterium]
MKTNILNAIILSGLLIFTSCSKSEDGTNDTKFDYGSASFKLNGNTISDAKPYIGIFVDNGTNDNVLTITGADSSETELEWKSNTTITKTLDSFSDAHYINAAGKSYYATSGELSITDYHTGSDGIVYATGTFHFNAMASSGSDSVVISAGIIAKATNHL